MAVRSFPPGFLLGSGTSAYQIEGGTDLDGRGPSIWDTFAARGGTRDGADGARAADHRTPLGRRRRPAGGRWACPPTASRWRGRGCSPPAAGRRAGSGLDFYRRAGRRPAGGPASSRRSPSTTGTCPRRWRTPAAGPPATPPYGFAEYAALVADALGDRVRRWGTVNEPWCAAMLGYAAGIHAPGRTEPGAAVAAAHHLLLAHGLAVDVLRSRLPADAEVGLTLNPYPVVAEGDTEADHDAARRIDGIANRLWYDPVLMGRYPDDVLADLSSVSDLAHIRDGDLAEIARPDRRAGPQLLPPLPRAPRGRGVGRVAVARAPPTST